MDQTDQHEAGLDLSGLGPYLAGIDFPIGKAALLDILARRQAPPYAVAQLIEVPLDTFDSVQDVLARVQPATL